MRRSLLRFLERVLRRAFEERGEEVLRMALLFRAAARLVVLLAGLALLFMTITAILEWTVKLTTEVLMRLRGSP